MRQNKWYYARVEPTKIPLASSNRDEVLSFIQKTNAVEWFTTAILRKPITNELVREYIQEIWLQLCEIKQEKWDDLYSQGKPILYAFVVKLIKNNLKSVTSNAYYHIKIPYRGEEYLTETEWLVYEDTEEMPDRITQPKYEETDTID